MKQIKSIIVDDELSAVHTLRGMLSEFCPMVQVVTAADNLELAVHAVEQYRPELVFLDIEMPPGGNGFEFLRQTENYGYGVIFTTSYAHYAIQAINEVQPWGFLVKPFRTGELVQAIHVAATKLKKQTAAPTHHAQRGILIGDMRKGNLVIRFSEIMYCQADGPCTAFFVQRAGKTEKITVHRSLKEVENELPAAFFCRVHHGYLVNMSYIQRYDRRGRAGVAYLPGDTRVDVSTHKMEHFVQQFGAFLRGSEEG